MIFNILVINFYEIMPFCLAHPNYTSPNTNKQYKTLNITLLQNYTSTNFYAAL
jgi:hypothetical protein